MNNERPNPFVTHVNLSPLLYRGDRSRNNSTKRRFHINCFLIFVSNHSCNILSNLSQQTELVILFSRFASCLCSTIFSFCLLVSGSLSGWINWHAWSNRMSQLFYYYKNQSAYRCKSVMTAPCNYRNDRTNTQFSDCLWFCV